MKCDIALAGVGGQGVLSLSGIIASSAMREGLYVKQSEVHGMAQRGGAVLAHLRLADTPIPGVIIPKGGAHLILSMEPVEGLRELPFLAEDGTLVTSSEPFENIPDYPDLGALLATIRALPRSIVVDAARLAREAGSARASNMVMVGAAFHLLPLRVETVEEYIRERFAGKGERVVKTNLDAFQAGREAAR